ncbi:hypothetical protein [Georgenia sp. Z1491]|uniref:hypothetical protein n=1 Tax=Georgenia sp. Z1491 TaxID=3416707 RepID=UPI003CE78EAC
MTGRTGVRATGTRTAAFGLLSALLALGACTDDAGADGLAVVGTSVAGWQQSADLMGDVEVGEFTALLRTQEEYTAWLDGLPHQEVTRDALTAELDLTDSVALAAAHPVCEERIEVVTDGEGALASRTVSTSDDQVDCAWSPIQVSVVEVPLEELGVDSADDVVHDQDIRDQGRTS